MLHLLVMQFPSRMRRFTGFLDPWDESVVYSAGYQLSQSLIAIGRGEWLGVGLGNSVQKLFYLQKHIQILFLLFSLRSLDCLVQSF